MGRSPPPTFRKARRARQRCKPTTRSQGAARRVSQPFSRACASTGVYSGCSSAATKPRAARGSRRRHADATIPVARDSAPPRATIKTSARSAASRAELAFACFRKLADVCAKTSFDGDGVGLFRRAELVRIAFAGGALSIPGRSGVRGRESGEANNGRKNENQLAHRSTL